jgi:hypothetical protein
MSYVFFVLQFYISGNSRSETSSDLPRVTQVVSALKGEEKQVRTQEELQLRPAKRLTARS